MRNGLEFCQQSASFILRRVFSHNIKTYNMGLMALFPLRRKSCYGFLLPFKIHCHSSRMAAVVSSKLTLMAILLQNRRKYFQYLWKMKLFIRGKNNFMCNELLLRSAYMFYFKIFFLMFLFVSLTII
jgi:hypothetical protein